MEGVKDFLESSTIHGLTYISTTTKYSKLFWVCTVCCGFLTACTFINNAASDWGENPVETSIETFPIYEISYPTVTVCPPKERFGLIHQIKKQSKLNIDRIYQILIQYKLI